MKRRVDKILRAWTFWIHSHLREECREYLEATKLKELVAVPGNLRAAALFRDLDDGTTEVVVVSLWDSMDSIVAFVGKDDLLKPTIEPSDRAKLFDREPHVRHFKMSNPDAAALIPPGWK
jgi:heme-degrading monooxygenase HmoA